MNTSSYTVVSQDRSDAIVRSAMECALKPHASQLDCRACCTNMYGLCGMPSAPRTPYSCAAQLQCQDFCASKTFPSAPAVNAVATVSADWSGGTWVNRGASHMGLYNSRPWLQGPMGWE